jgi:hypothetical protein
VQDFAIDEVANYGGQSSRKVAVLWGVQDARGCPPPSCALKYWLRMIGLFADWRVAAPVDIGYEPPSITGVISGQVLSALEDDDGRA